MRELSGEMQWKKNNKQRAKSTELLKFVDI
jgi:hypothetical protein